MRRYRVPVVCRRYRASPSQTLGTIRSSPQGCGESEMLNSASIEWNGYLRRHRRVSLPSMLQLLLFT